jgi:hypothetical protein
MANGDESDSGSRTTFTLNLGDVQLTDEERGAIQNAILESTVERVDRLRRLEDPPSVHCRFDRYFGAAI